MASTLVCPAVFPGAVSRLGALTVLPSDPPASAGAEIAADVSPCPAPSPEIPWQDVAGLRDILIHEYQGVDFAIVWDIAVNEVPALHQAVSELLK